MATIRFQDALSLPFREQNRGRLLWIPGAVLLSLQLFSVGLGVGAVGVVYLMTGGIPDKESLTWRLVDAGIQLLSALLSFLVSLPLMGYIWQLIGQWRTEGDKAVPPLWFSGGLLWKYTLDGLKLMLYYVPASMVSTLPVILTIVVVAIFIAGGYDVLSSLRAGGYVVAVLLVLLSVFTVLAVGFFLAPFFFAPIVLSSQTRKLSDLFRLLYAWNQAVRHYAMGLKATGYMLAAAMLFMVATIFLMCTCVGILLLPFLQFIYYVVLAHLAMQVFPLEQTEPADIPETTTGPSEAP